MAARVHARALRTALQPGLAVSRGGLRAPGGVRGPRSAQESARGSRTARPRRVRAPPCAGSRERDRSARASPADEAAAGRSRGRAKPEALAFTPVRGSPGSAAGPGVTCMHHALPAGAERSPRCLRGRGRTPQVWLRAPPRCLRLPNLSEQEWAGTNGERVPEPWRWPCWERQLR